MLTLARWEGTKLYLAIELGMDRSQDMSEVWWLIRVYIAWNVSKCFENIRKSFFLTSAQSRSNGKEKVWYNKGPVYHVCHEWSSPTSRFWFEAKCAATSSCSVRNWGMFLSRKSEGGLSMIKRSHIRSRSQEPSDCSSHWGLRICHDRDNQNPLGRYLFNTVHTSGCNFVICSNYVMMKTCHISFAKLVCFFFLIFLIQEIANKHEVFTFDITTEKCLLQGIFAGVASGCTCVDSLMTVGEKPAGVTGNVVTCHAFIFNWFMWWSLYKTAT